MEIVYNMDQFAILVMMLIFFYALAVDKENIFKPILFWCATPLAIAIGISYLGNTIYSVGFFIGITMFLLGVMFSFAGTYYSLTYGKQKE